MKLDGLRMAKGVKTGGRKVGSVNKKTADIQRAVEESGVTPLEFMLAMMRDEANEPRDRLSAAVAAAPYVHAKLANITLSGDADNPVAVTQVERRII